MTRGLLSRPASSARNRMRCAMGFAQTARNMQAVADAARVRGDSETAALYDELAMRWDNLVECEAKWAFHYAGKALALRMARAALQKEAR